jgi:predicted metal-dependent phosphoesterase TrpH
MKLNIDKIEQARKSEGRPKAFLIKHIPITRQGLCNVYKKKRASFETIERIAELLKIDPRELLIQ